jgi:hypothetical protein
MKQHYRTFILLAVVALFAVALAFASVTSVPPTALADDPTPTGPPPTIPPPTPPVPTPPPSNPGTADLVAWWEFEESSGTRYDSHGSNDLTAYNTPGRLSGKVGYGVDLEADQEETLRIASSNDFDISDHSLSVAFWFKPESGPTSGTRRILRQGQSGSGGYTIWQTSSGTLGCKVWGSSGSAEITGQWETISSGWSFYACVYDAVNEKLYLTRNGILWADPEDTSFTDAAYEDNIFIGSWNFNTGFLDGGLDELSVWDEALWQSEVSWLYNGGSGRSYADLD